jgi:hypothetical protein
VQRGPEKKGYIEILGLSELRIYVEQLKITPFGGKGA